MVVQAFDTQHCRCVFCRSMLPTRGPSKFMLQRKDQEANHANGNLVLCCRACYLLRSTNDYDFDEFLQLRREAMIVLNAPCASAAE